VSALKLAAIPGAFVIRYLAAEEPLKEALISIGVVFPRIRSCFVIGDARGRKAGNTLSSSS
jgi:hypothetical protein